eukprot:3302984-Prymnesium_polylepis.2
MSAAAGSGALVALFCCWSLVKRVRHKRARHRAGYNDKTRVCASSFKMPDLTSTSTHPRHLPPGYTAPRQPPVVRQIKSAPLPCGTSKSAKELRGNKPKSQDALKSRSSKLSREVSREVAYNVKAPSRDASREMGLNVKAPSRDGSHFAPSRDGSRMAALSANPPSRDDSYSPATKGVRIAPAAAPAPAPAAAMPPVRYHESILPVRTNSTLQQRAGALVTGRSGRGGKSAAPGCCTTLSTTLASERL